MKSKIIQKYMKMLLKLKKCIFEIIIARVYARKNPLQTARVKKGFKVKIASLFLKWSSG